MKNFFYPTMFMAVALLVLAMLMAPRVLAAPSAATLTVNSTLDEPDSNVNDGQCISTPSGKCTPRAAVMQANVVNVDTTILVPSGIYTLTIPPIGVDGPETGDLNLTTPVSGSPVISIIGAGAGTTIIDANQLDRVFHVHSGRSATISGVTIRNGYIAANYGGGIYTEFGSTLTVTNSALSGNSAPNGGGILNKGLLSLISSTVSQNLATDTGGGITNGGEMNIGSSTIYDNSATFDGGGIRNGNILLVMNSTISLNNVNNNGGGIYNYGATNVYNSTIFFNGADADVNGGSGAGVFTEPSLGTFNLRNTLVAGNYLQNAPVYDDCAGILNSYGRNLFWMVNGGCTINTGSGSWTTLNSLSGIGNLQNNGGPTWTQALLSGSNAIDGGDPALGCIGPDSLPFTTDQRGAARVVGVRCDIGAFEFRPPIYLPLILR